MKDSDHGMLRGVGTSERGIKCRLMCIETKCLFEQRRGDKILLQGEPKR